MQRYRFLRFLIYQSTGDSDYSVEKVWFQKVRQVGGKRWSEVVEDISTEELFYFILSLFDFDSFRSNIFRSFDLLSFFPFTFLYFLFSPLLFPSLLFPFPLHSVTVPFSYSFSSFCSFSFSTFILNNQSLASLPFLLPHLLLLSEVRYVFLFLILLV